MNLNNPLHHTDFCVLRNHGGPRGSSGGFLIVRKRASEADKSGKKWRKSGERSLRQEVLDDRLFAD
ncbi:MAG: hypothetical protein ABFC54_12675, partial [Thermoguttaceae bacterium]